MGREIAYRRGKKRDTHRDDDRGGHDFEDTERGEGRLQALRVGTLRRDREEGRGQKFRAGDEAERGQPRRPKQLVGQG